MANRTPAPDFESIDLTALDTVTGGRISRSSQPDPQVLAGIQQLGQLIQQLGQGIISAQQQGPAQMMQFMQQMMQMRGGQ